MNAWFAFERRWCAAVLGAVLPANSALALPSAAEVDLAPFWARFAIAAPLLLRVGLRAAVWLLTWLPLLSTARPLHRLPPARRDHFLHGMLTSRWYLARQLVTLVKLVACLALFRQPDIRARFQGVRP